MRYKPDRAVIAEEWIDYVIAHPERVQTQDDGRIRKWAKIGAAGNRYLRVVLLEDGETLHNAVFDRGFRP